MNIRPKNTILFAQTGVKFSQNNLRGANWRQQVFNNYRQHLLDQLAKYGEADDYGKWLNEMQARHSNIYNLAGGEKGNWEDIAYKNDLVGQYQQDYRGGLGNDGQYKRFGTISINPEDKYDFNQTGIKTNQETRYNIVNPPSRTSGDYSRDGYNYKVDNLYSAITDDRRLLGRKGDWDENSEEYKQWQKDLNSRGWETYLDTKDNYYKLRKFTGEIDGGNPLGDDKEVVITPAKKEDPSITEGQKQDPESPWANFGNKLKAAAPDILDTLRLTGNLHNNSRVFDHMMKAIRPSLQQTYLTHRQVVGDEATKQAYYRRAAQGQTQAAKPFTSDADRQMAYMMEAKRVGDELRAQGDLADNQMIRQTSDESNQHEWGNTQRRTEVANYNINQLNQAYAAKEQLKAQKHSADWTNVDNYLMGIQNKWEQKRAKQEAIQDQLNALQMQDDLANNSQIKEAETQLNDLAKKLYPNGNINWNDTRLSDAIKNLQSVKRKEYIKQYRLLYGKRGAKVEYTADDKYLYKTSRDIVEHFRKMSKLADDSRIKTRPKPIKLSPHPDGNKRRKYQLGGVAPFTIYRPLGIGGQQTISASSDTGSSKSSSSKDTAAKDKLDMIKELFKSVRGLPVDVNAVYSDLSNLFAKYKAFGEEMSTDDIASIYLNSMQKINNLKYSQDVYEKAKALATSKESLEEFAVDSRGRFVVQDKDGNISYVKGWKEALESGKNPLTNQQLLDQRAYNPDLMSRKGDYIIENVVNNGMGINKIAAQIKALAGSLSSTEEKIDGISQVESSKVKAGLKILAGAPDGYYKHTINDKNQQAQVNAALNYITNMLSLSQKATLETHGGVKENIAAFLSSQTGSTHEVNISPLTGKASKDNSGSGGKGDSDNSAGLAFVLGQGPRVPVVFNTGTSYQITANGIQGVLQNKSNENLGQGATLQDATKSQEGGYFQWNKATFGGSKLISTAFSHIILNDSTIIGVDLPYKKGIDGNEVPDFQQLKRMEAADDEIRQKGIQSNDYNNINQIYQNHQLPPKYDQNGKLNKQDYRRFAVIQATLDETSLQNKNAILSDEVAIANEVERDLYNESMRKITGNNKFELDEGWPIFGGETKLYKGSIFVPYQEDIAFAALSSGKPLNVDLPNNSSTVQQMQYAPATLNYKPQDITLSQIKNN